MTAMTLSGKSLGLVYRALDLAIAELQTQIGTCTDVQKWADNLEELEVEKVQLRKLMARIEKKLTGLEMIK
jgi:hypothetical protein